MKSIKTQERIEVIKNEIKAHHKNIELLNRFFGNYIFNQKNCGSFRRVRYTTIPKSISVYQFTVKNLKDQVVHLKRELNVLIEFGK
jgi:hypothetical protein